jgi:hypothetical protein
MIFNSPLILVTLLAVILLPSQGFAKRPPKPPPEPVTAADVVCNGCVDTIDIADGAVTTVELSDGVNDLLDAISQLQAQINQLQSLPHDRIEVYDGDNNLLGISITLPATQLTPDNNLIPAVSAIYNQAANVFVPLENRTILNSVPVFIFLPHLVNIYFESFDCTGQGYIGTLAAISLTKDVLVTNGEVVPKFYKTLDHSLLEQRNYISNSRLGGTSGNCSEGGGNEATGSHTRMSPVVEVQNPLPYSLPIIGPLRLEYVGD